MKNNIRLMRNELYQYIKYQQERLLATATMLAKTTVFVELVSLSNWLPSLIIESGIFLADGVNVLKFVSENVGSSSVCGANDFCSILGFIVGCLLLIEVTE